LPTVARKILSDLQLEYEPFIKCTSSFLYIQQNFGVDSVGDIRISYKYLPCSKATLICSVQGYIFRPYDYRQKKFKKYIEDDQGKTSLISGDGNCTEWTSKCIDATSSIACWECGKIRFPLENEEKIHWIFQGEMLTKEDAFKQRIGETQVGLAATYGIRIVCLQLFIMGYYLVTNPIIGIFALNRILSEYTEFSNLIISVLFGILHLVDVVSIAWILYKPIQCVMYILLSWIIVIIIIMY